MTVSMTCWMQKVGVVTGWGKGRGALSLLCLSLQYETHLSSGYQTLWAGGFTSLILVILKVSSDLDASMILSVTEGTVWHLPWFALSESQSCMIQWCCLFLANVQMMFSPSTLRSYWCSKQLTGLSLQVPESCFLKLTEWHYWENFFLIWILFSFCARIPLNKRIKICVVIPKLFPQALCVLKTILPLHSMLHNKCFPVEGLCFSVLWKGKDSQLTTTSLQWKAG